MVHICVGQPLKVVFAKMDQGAKRLMSQVVFSFLKSILSCNLLDRPCQNSKLSGLTKNPPHCSGFGISISLYFNSSSRKLLFKTSLDGISLLCDEAQAPSWLPLGRDLKYSMDFSTEVFCFPLIITCLSSPAQKKERHVRELFNKEIPLSEL